MNPNTPQPAVLLNRLLEDCLRALQRRQAPVEEDTPAGLMTREFFANNWAGARDGLLARTSRIRLEPELSPAPHRFRFEIDRPYKRKRPGGPVSLVPGPIRGEIVYRPDFLTEPDGPMIAVLIDADLCFFHPNYSRQHGMVCLGDLPPGPPLSLEGLLLHLYAIVSYQNWRASDPVDLEAARYFALDPSALDGLESVETLY